MLRKTIFMMLILGAFVFAEEAKTWNGDVDNFEDGNIAEAPAWWTFGNSEQKPVATTEWDKDPLSKYLGKFALKITGEAKDWYVGGMGTYLGVDASAFNYVKIYVCGTGPDSGKLTVQLYDDDNGNYVLEQDVDKNYEPLNDDRFEYSINVNWKGWKPFLIPISSFKDTNPKVGDNIWNPDHKNGSGGLLHMQFIFLANTKTGSIDMAVDNIKLMSIKGKQGVLNEK